MTVRVRAPYGTVVEVSEEKAERLKYLGYTVVQDKIPEPVVIQPKRRGRPPKAKPNEE